MRFGGLGPLPGSVPAGSPGTHRFRASIDRFSVRQREAGGQERFRPVTEWTLFLGPRTPRKTGTADGGVGLWRIFRLQIQACLPAITFFEIGGLEREDDHPVLHARWRRIRSHARRLQEGMRHLRGHAARMRLSVRVTPPECVFPSRCGAREVWGNPPARLRGTMENASTGQMRSSNPPPGCGAGCSRVCRPLLGV